MIRTTPFSSHQHGVTLLEVLIAILVLSFGLMGLLGLIMNGLKITTSSHYRTIAAQQIVAMADLVNANPDIASTYSPPNPVTGTAYCITTACLSNQIAPADYDRWLLNIAASLPNGGGVLCLDASPADGNLANFSCSGTGRPTVKVCWNENARISISSGGGSGTDSSTDTCLSTQL